MKLSSRIGRICKHFIKGNYNFLLIFLFLLFISRPNQPIPISIELWKIFLVSTVLLAIFNANHPFTTRIVVTALGIPSVALTIADVSTQSPLFNFGVPISTGLFLGVCAFSILRSVIINARVTIETLRGAVCVYFLVAFTFAHIFSVIELIYPHTFQINGEYFDFLSNRYFYFSQLLYFSFVTLLTIGYGDIVATQDWGQTSVVVEGILGQLYIAILVARMVSVYSLYSNRKLLVELLKHEEK